MFRFMNSIGLQDCIRYFGALFQMFGSNFAW